MKIFKINLLKLFFVVAILNTFYFGVNNAAVAIENQYSNSLLQVKMEKSSNNEVNVVIYSSNPYKLNLKPVKRSENEYVIMLPETYHSITSKPSVSSLEGAVQDVDVKLLPYIGAKTNNGYTKITIKTAPNVQLNVKNQVMKSNNAVDNDLMSLIEPKQKINIAKAEPTKPILKIVKIYKKPAIVEKKLDVKIAQIKKETSQTVRKIEKSKIASEQKQSELRPQKSAVKKAKNNTITAQKEPKIKVNENQLALSNEEAVRTALVLEKKAETNIESNSQPVPEKKSLPLSKFFSSLLFMLLFPIALFVAMIKIINKFIGKQKQQANTESLNQTMTVNDNLESTESEFYVAEQPHAVIAQQAFTNAEETEECFHEICNEEDDFFCPEEEVEFEDIKEECCPEPIEEELVIENNKETVLEKAESEKLLNVISEAEITDNKGFYLIDLEGQKALIGLIGSDIFVLNRFESDIINTKILAKINEKKHSHDVYFVQIEKWRALIGVSKDEMKLLIEL